MQTLDKGVVRSIGVKKWSFNSIISNLIKNDYFNDCNTDWRYGLQAVMNNSRMQTIKFGGSLLIFFYASLFRSSRGIYSLFSKLICRCSLGVKLLNSCLFYRFSLLSLYADFLNDVFQFIKARTSNIL